MLHLERKSILYTSQQRSMYIGRLERVIKRANVASTLLVSIEDDLELVSAANGRKIRSKSFLIPAGMNVTIDTHGAKVAQCFLNDMGADLAKLIPQMKTSLSNDKNSYIYCDIHNEAQLINHAGYLLSQRPSNEVAFEQFDEWMGAFPINTIHSVDPRVEKAASLIKENYTENLSVEQVAKSVGLSVPRLSQLFKQVTGVPMRRFRLWYRLFAAAAKFSQGYSLTDAAIAAGFADYPQLCRVFRELTGSKPSIAKKHTEIRVLAGCYL